MDFKEMIDADITKVFINVDEFGDVYEYEGKAVTMIVEEESAEDLKNIQRSLETASEGVFVKAKTLYVKTSDVIIPRQDERVTFEGQKYYVLSTFDSDGILKIVLNAHDY